MRRDPLFVGPCHERLSLPSAILMTIVGVLCKTFLRFGTRHRLLNPQNLEPFINYQPPATNNSPADAELRKPILTLTNHNSTLDDPLMWAFVSWSTVFFPWRLRWSMAAHDICFPNPPLRWFFSHVQTLPIIRGSGIHQPTMNHALDILDSGGWVHIFPEGKVNEHYLTTRQMLPFKWGIGRLIMESKIPPIIIPIFHIGMEQVKPYDNYLPRLGKKLTVAIGEPIDSSLLLKEIESEGTLSEDEKRSALTAKCRRLLEAVQQQAEQSHFN